MKRNLLLFFAMFLCAFVNAQEGGGTTFTYVEDKDNMTTWGTKQAETYDVAIKLADSYFVGKTITAISVPVVSSSKVTEYSIWLSKKLTLKSVSGKKVNSPDIQTVSVTPENDMIQITLAEPYTITEDGVFVGYSFKVKGTSSVSNYPVIVGLGKKAGAFYIHTSQTYSTSWSDRSQTYERVSAIEVTLQGGERANAAAISEMEDACVKVGEAGFVDVAIANHGSNAISSVGYSYTLDGKTYTKDYKLSEPIAAEFGKSVWVSLPLDAFDFKGEYEMTLSLDKVNGETNEEPSSMTGKLGIYSILAKHVPLVEEFTGLWCGYCPIAYVGLKEMSKLYPDDFIAVAYHYNDVMEIIYSSNWPLSVSGFPTSYLDRSKIVDVYSGNDSKNVFGFDKVWKSEFGKFAMGVVSAEANWNENKPTQIDVKATMQFAQNISKANYGVSFVLVADGLTGTDANWWQTNYYGGDVTYKDSRGMEDFYNGGPYVKGLVFDHVAIAGSNLAGIAGSVPSTIEEAKEYTYSYSFDISTINKAVIQDTDKLHVVAVLVDRDANTVVNCCRTHIGKSSSGIEAAVANDAEVISEMYYDATGRAVSNPGNGIYLKKQVLKNGTTTTSKVVIK